MADLIRKAAFETLAASDEHPSVLVKRTLDEHQEWDHRDGAFYTALVETEVAHQTTIDAIIAAYSKTRLKKLDTKVLAAVRLALAQIFFLEKVPDSAACNESVNILKASGHGKYAGFANGLIRHIIREKNSPQARVVSDNTSVRLKYVNGHWQVTDQKQKAYQSLLDRSLRYSYPYWIVEFLYRNYSGEPVLEGLTAKRQITAVSKVPPEKIDLECKGEQITDGVYGLTFPVGTNPAESVSFRDGQFYIMDMSSMQPLINAGLEKGVKALDLCASPGGKSVMAAWLYDAEVTSCDVSEAKTARIKENVHRLQLGDQITVAENDACIYNDKWESAFDAVIADCPCSGLGVSGRKPEIRLRLKSEDFTELAGIQKQILENAARYVKPGGTLIYSTCTLDPLENEDQVTGFLSRHSDFSLAKQQTIIPDDRHDGFFYSILQKHENGDRP
ncbi:MAG: transcription antitermination factor NusB [Lachnospiraceae bacterium]|nr:transcription antitermination factor NusB [Lachnospiraceae bacterium]